MSKRRRKQRDAWSVERNRQILAYYLENNTLDECGQRFGGITRERVRQIINKMGVKPRPSTKITIQRETLNKNRTLTTRNRLLSQIKIGAIEECWEWQSSTSSHYGYGIMGCAVLNEVYAHRIAYILFYRKRIKGVIRHKCDNCKCCNPHHLIDGTQTQNVEDRNSRRFEYWKERTTAGRGTIKGNTKFWASDVQKMQNLRSGGLSYSEIAKNFQTSYMTISRILNGKVQAYENFL